MATFTKLGRLKAKIAARLLASQPQECTMWVTSRCVPCTWAAAPDMTPRRTLATGSGPCYITDLPRLPVPPLQGTVDRFLATAKPHVTSDEEYHRIYELAKDFVQPGGPGEELQNLLVERAEVKDNWLEEWWDNIAYLEFRGPNALLVNPGFTGPYFHFKSLEEQLRYAANIIVGVLHYKQRFDSGGMPQDSFKGQPLCMSNSFKIFSTCRIPKLGRDCVHISPFEDQSRHVTVLHNNHIFSLDVYDADGNCLAPLHLEAQLKKIVEQSSEPGPGLGIMTTENRDTWAGVYEQISEDAENRRHLNEIHKSVFVLCLDEDVPNMAESRTLQINHMAHGNGSKFSSCNRWFDKVLSFIVTRGGAFGANVEHSTSDGTTFNAVAVCVMDFKDNVMSGPPVSDPRRLDFNLNGAVQQSIEVAKENFDKLIADLDLEIKNIPELGYNFIKSLKASPDAFIQVAMQLGYYRFHGRPAPTYESASLRHFKHGRTETIRSCSIASHAYCQAMTAGSLTSQQEKRRLLREAIESHRSYTKLATSGNGIDRHLLGLKLIAKEHGLAVPAFLTDRLLQETSHWLMSTSQVFVEGGVFSFAPVTPDGYGLFYTPRPEEILFNISAWRSCSSNDPRELGCSIHQALLEGRDLLL